MEEVTLYSQTLIGIDFSGMSCELAPPLSGLEICALYRDVVSMFRLAPQTHNASLITPHLVCSDSSVPHRGYQRLCRARVAKSPLSPIMHQSSDVGLYMIVVTYCQCS